MSAYPKKLVFLFIPVCLLTTNLHAGQPTYVAGKFYPAGKSELETQVNKFMEGEGLQRGRPRILIVPHAGYEFSGAIAGRAFREIREKDYEVVILLGVAHQHPISGAVLDPEGSFETPLGKIPVDAGTSLRLLTLTQKVRPNPAAFQNEHSLEVQLPFLQRALLYFKIVPLLMQQPDLKTAQEIGEAIATVMKENETAGKRTLLVVSTDFSHYPSREDALLSDSAMLKPIEAVDPQGLFRESREMMRKKIPNLATTMCGEAGVLAGLYAAKSLGILKASVLAQSTSADSKSGDASRVVGYAAAAFYDAPADMQKKAAQESTAFPALRESQKKELLQAARASVKEYLETGKALGSLHVKDEAFNKPEAVFVTLRKNGELRGCVGTTYPKFPLKQAVIYYAVAAATQDPRFPPVQKEEYDSLRFEVSILSPQKRVPGPEAIEPGRDGVVLIQGNHVGLLLPEVWKTTGWTKEQFLNELASQKAGLKDDAWKDPSAKLYTFTTQSFGEAKEAE